MEIIERVAEAIKSAPKCAGVRRNKRTNAFEVIRYGAVDEEEIVILGKFGTQKEAVTFADNLDDLARAKACIQAMREPEETAPKGVPVIVQGGLAMKKTGGEWFTGMEEPLYQRPLQWTPEWWMPLPGKSGMGEG